MQLASSLAPLFGGLPGGSELLFVGFAVFLVPVALGILVWQDARSHADHPVAWGAAALVASFSPLFVGGLAVAVLYWLSRDELGTAAPPTFGESDLDESDQVLGQPLGGGPGAGPAPGEADEDDDLGGFERPDVVDDGPERDDETDGEAGRSPDDATGSGDNVPADESAADADASTTEDDTTTTEDDATDRDGR